jgi:ribosomal protein S18 acetylase RimI-like enzyme
MIPEPPRIRQGQPADVERLVDLHCQVFDERTHLAMLFGRAFLRAAYQWYSDSPEAFALVAEVDGEVRGSCTVNRGSYYVVFRRNVRALVGSVFRKPSVLLNRAVWRRLGALRPKRGRTVGDVAYLAYLTVSDAGRRAGIGKALVTAAIEECGRRRWGEMVTAFHRDNVPARLMYKSLGFEEFAELTHDDLVGIRLRITSRPLPLA